MTNVKYFRMGENIVPDNRPAFSCPVSLIWTWNTLFSRNMVESLTSIVIIFRGMPLYLQFGSFLPEPLKLLNQDISLTLCVIHGWKALDVIVIYILT